LTLGKEFRLELSKEPLFELSLFHPRVETLYVVVKEKPKCTYQIGKVQCKELKLLILSLGL
jgi:hypothetical protein